MSRARKLDRNTAAWQCLFWFNRNAVYARAPTPADARPSLEVHGQLGARMILIIHVGHAVASNSSTRLPPAREAVVQEVSIYRVRIRSSLASNCSFLPHSVS